VNVPKLVTAYYELRPDPSDPRQRVVFGTSGHRGSALDVAFNEWHILAITQAICDYRKLQNIDGPLFLGIDTHALSEPAFASALEVLAANNIEVMLSEGAPYTPRRWFLFTPPLTVLFCRSGLHPDPRLSYGS
jgi:phosphoglucomutase